VTLNISDTQKTEQASSRRRRRLAEAVVDELLSWKPREFLTVFRRGRLGAVSLIHLNVLMVLEADGPLSMGQLAEELDVSVASMTGIVDRMETRSLVERRRGETDRRVVLVHPTEAGQQLFGDIDQRRREGLTQLMAALSDEELKALLIGHRALRKARMGKHRRRMMEAGDAAHRSADRRSPLVLKGAHR
jgi:DNA-binding MarR family transcriptional regulator